MALKDVFEVIKGRLKDKDSAEDFVTQLTTAYKKKKELGLKDPVDSTVAKIMEVISQSDDPNLTAERILKAAIEQEQMPNRIPEKLSVIISQSEELKDDIVGNVIDSADVDVPDEFIDRVLEDGELGLKNRLRLLGNVNDEEIVERRVTQEFETLYDISGDLNDNALVRRIEAIASIVKDSNSDMDIVPQAERVISKKIAENFYDDLKRGTLLFSFSTIIPFERMLEDDIPSMVGEEFEKLENESGKKSDRYQRTELLKQILGEVGKNVAARYTESKDSTKRFIVPRSKTMENLTTDEADAFVRSVEIYSRKKLTKKEIKSIVEQMRGVIRNDNTRAMLIVNAMGNLPDKDESVEKLTTIMSSEQKIRTIFMMEEIGLLDRFEKMSPEKREKALQIIAETLYARTKGAAQPQASDKPKTLSKAIKPENPNPGTRGGGEDGGEHSL